MPVATISDGCLFSEEALVMPRDDVRNADFDRNYTARANVFFDRASRGDFLDNPIFAPLSFRSTTA
jgi:hypothetical protein